MSAVADELEKTLAVLQEHGLLSRIRVLRVGSVQIEMDQDIAGQYDQLTNAQRMGFQEPNERVIGDAKPKAPEPEEAPYEYSHAE